MRQENGVVAALTEAEACYLFLQDLDRHCGQAGKLAGVLSRNGAANLTVCPRCRVDDFVHVENCVLADRS